eukprot:TRINITY_DN23480_c0_g1_i1.p1 TRINITY_DN23480_c0_g1~~TRINITY_DN23480_c0_g1_i1.p1  ORF type:complete len:982 (+),score=218.35 TRINITY_DN23480_c0_g1_i1:113-3058(+)
MQRSQSLTRTPPGKQLRRGSAPGVASVADLRQNFRDRDAFRQTTALLDSFSIASPSSTVKYSRGGPPRLDISPTIGMRLTAKERKEMLRAQAIRLKESSQQDPAVVRSLDAQLLDLSPTKVPTPRVFAKAADNGEVKSAPLPKKFSAQALKTGSQAVEGQLPPTEEMRKASRQKTQKRTVTMHPSRADGRSVKLPPPSSTSIGALLPSVKECLNRFFVDVMSEEEQGRIRTVFMRFATDGEVVRDCLHELLVHLGFLTVTEEEADRVAKETTEFSTLDLQDFADFVERYMMVEREHIQEKMQVWQQQGAEANLAKGPAARITSFLDLLGVVCLSRDVKAIMEVAGLADHPCDTPEAMLRFLAALRSCEGFSQDDIADVLKAFEECEHERCFRPGSEGALIKAEELSNGLLDFGGLYAVEHIRKLMELIADGIEGDRPLGVGIYEFMVCARRLRTAVLNELHTQFKKLDDDEDCFITGEDLVELCKPLGFSLVEAEFDELLEATELATDSFIDLDSAYSFVTETQERNGFTKKEQEELTESFERFCDESGEMPSMKVAELLQWMGFETTLDDVRRMVQQVDFNGNGTMDIGEFLTLMRLQKELSLNNYRNAYDKHELGGLSRQSFQEQAVHKALIKGCNMHPQKAVLQQAMSDMAKSKEGSTDWQMSFEDFLRIAETCRKLIPLESRKMAFFKDEQFVDLQKAFQLQDTAGNCFISVGELLWMLGDSGLPVNTVDGRAKLYECLEQARSEALEAGVAQAEVGNPGSPRVRFMPIVHLIRIHVKAHEQQVFEKEEAVLKRVKFSSQEVTEFRALFEQYARESASESQSPTSSAANQKEADNSSNSGHKSKLQKQFAFARCFTHQLQTQSLSAVLRRLTREPRVVCSHVVTLLKELGVRVSGKPRAELLAQLSEVCDSDETMDFAGFLRIMQWAMDSNFGNINGVAERIASSVNKEVAAALNPLAHMSEAAATVRPRDARRISV